MGPTVRPALRAAVAYAAAWSPLVIVFLVLIAARNPLPLHVALWAAVRSVGVAALLGLGVIAYARRWPLPEGRWRLFLARHLGASVAYGGAWMAAIAWFIALDAGGWAAARAMVADWWAWQVVTGAMLYWGIAGGVWARDAARRARDREAARREAEALRVQAELSALRGQIDPHFLFNTLHTVGALIRQDPATAARALERLADLLRYVLDAQRGAREDVPLADELAFVDAYLELEGLRLGDRLRVERQVAPESLSRRVPSLALQPLVENAIRYGVAPRPEGGTVRVASRLDADALVVEVADDGPGASAAATTGTGIGLTTLRRRLAARYGVAAAVDVRTGPGAGFAVTVRVPA